MVIQRYRQCTVMATLINNTHHTNPTDNIIRKRDSQRDLIILKYLSSMLVGNRYTVMSTSVMRSILTTTPHHSRVTHIVYIYMTSKISYQKQICTSVLFSYYSFLLIVESHFSKFCNKIILVLILVTVMACGCTTTIT